jgi:hypothetical protein
MIERTPTAGRISSREMAGRTPTAGRISSREMAGRTPTAGRISSREMAGFVDKPAAPADAPAIPPQRTAEDRLSLVEAWLGMMARNQVAIEKQLDEKLSTNALEVNIAELVPQQLLNAQLTGTGYVKVGTNGGVYLDAPDSGVSGGGMLFSFKAVDGERDYSGTPTRTVQVFRGNLHVIGGTRTDSGPTGRHATTPAGWHEFDWVDDRYIFAVFEYTGSSAGAWVTTGFDDEDGYVLAGDALPAEFGAFDPRRVIPIAKMDATLGVLNLHCGDIAIYDLKNVVP